MTAINYAELALIELEYSAADHLARQSATLIRWNARTSV